MIESLLSFKNQEASDALEAVKWIGNTGSHEANLSVSDVLDGVEMLGHALRSIFDDQAAALKKKDSVCE